MNSSDFQNFLLSRSSVREFSDREIDPDDLMYIMHCASTAPSAGNRESWDVVIVSEQGLREDLSDAAFGQKHIMDAPVILAVSANYVRSMSQYGERGIMYAIEDATIACTYMMLAAHSKGISSCWTGAFDEETVSEILSLPAHARPVALLAIGYGHLPSCRAERMPVLEHIHEEIW